MDMDILLLGFIDSVSLENPKYSSLGFGFDIEHDQLLMLYLHIKINMNISVELTV